MKKDSLLIERLKHASPEISAETLDRLARSLAVPVSFDELEEALPPAVRYLGPGVWAETIGKSLDE
jgi:hypothetical protein